MKKIISIFMVLILVFVLVSCGSKAPKTIDDVKGETLESNTVSVLVPDKWFGYFSSDLFDEYEEDYNPNTVNIYFDAKSELAALNRPGIMITYYPEDTLMWEPSPDFYENSEVMDDIVIGGRTYSGFTATSLSYPLTILWTKEPDQIQITIWTENGGKSISLDDLEVQAILNSFTIK